MTNVTSATPNAAVVNVKPNLADLRNRLRSGSAPAAVAKAKSDEIPWGENHPEYKRIGKEEMINCPILGKAVTAKYYGETLLRNYPHTNGVTLKVLIEGYQSTIAELDHENQQLKSEVTRLTEQLATANKAAVPAKK